MKDKRGVFGLNSVQAFFGLILAIAILLFIIVIIMGILNDSGISGRDSLFTTLNNETILLGDGGQGITTANNLTQPVLSNIIVTNATSGVIILAGNYSENAGVFSTVTSSLFNNTNVNISARVDYKESVFRTQSLTQNVSTGATNFTSDINPVYAVLAVLVIILILVVLVRVVGDRRSLTGSPGI